MRPERADKGCRPIDLDMARKIIYRFFVKMPYKKRV